MRYTTTTSTILALALICVCSTYAQNGVPFGVKESQATSADLDVTTLLSAKKDRRRRELRALSSRYEATRHALEAVLHQAIKERRGDRRYMSPLHCAILAVAEWRVYQAEDELLSIIDYELTMRSLPRGISVGGSFFFPAANALVDLRVAPSKVVKAIAMTKDQQKLHLLTWVLYKRAGSTDEARRMLTPAGGNANIQKALQILKGAPADLLPTPSDASNNKGD